MMKNSNYNSSESWNTTILDLSHHLTSHYYVYPSECPYSVSVTPEPFIY